ncbi:MFS transporter, partial [Lactiplantibacillus xiangfangensis]
RLCQGIADGIALPLMFAVVLDQVPKKKVGTFMGIGSLVIAFAPAVGPIYGGIIQDTLNWHFLFIILIPIIMVTWLL